jgi:hypothetical protein
VSCGYATSGISGQRGGGILGRVNMGGKIRGRAGKKGVREGCRITAGGAPCPLEPGAHSRESRTHDKHPCRAPPQPSTRACKGEEIAGEPPHRANHVGDHHPRGGLRRGVCDMAVHARDHSVKRNPSRKENRPGFATGVLQLHRVYLAVRNCLPHSRS